MMEAKRPKVSVCVITYNHSHYIRQCLQSIVDQVTAFDFEIIVGDDCSTDGTREIVIELSKQYPDKIVPVLYENKVGGTQNYLAVHNKARGEFVAHIDGDDMALPGKLQVQADYLDKHAGCAVVWHRMYLFNDDVKGYCIANEPDLSPFQGGRLYLTDVLTLGSVVYHSSMMYRRTARKTKEFSGEVMDWYYTVEFLSAGYGKYLDLILGKYRVSNNQWSSKNARLRSIRTVYLNTLNQYVNAYPQHRCEIFINCVIGFLVDVRNFRSTAFSFIPLMFRTFSLVSPKKLVFSVLRLRKISKMGRAP